MSAALLACLGALFALVALGAPIALSMIAGSVVWLAIKGHDLGLAAENMLQRLYGGYIVLAVPLFIVAANIMNAGTISDRLLGFCVAVAGRFRGGLAHVNIAASVVFSGMSGSAVADAAGIGKIVTEMMIRSGRYGAGFSAALTAASATIGPIIPPSIPMVMYALVSNASIGYLFLAGVVPGLIMAAALMALVWVQARRRGFAPETAVPLAELPRRTLRAAPALAMPVILLAGIYGGATTPTEAAAVAAVYALLVAGLLYRSLSLADLRAIFVESARASAAIGLVVGAALILNYVVASENVPRMLAAALRVLDLGPTAFLLLVVALILLLGCVIDAAPIILVIVPIFLPACAALGIDLVHFGIVAVVATMIGLVTPPYGMLLFVISVAAGVRLGEILRELPPLILALVAAVVAMVLLPDLVLWLPRRFGYPG